MPSRMTIHNLQLYMHHAEALGTRLICTHTCMYTASLILKLYAGMSLMVRVCISYCKWWMLCKSGKICCMHVCLHFMLQVMDAGKDNQVCVCACMRACVCACVCVCVRACVHCSSPHFIPCWKREFIRVLQMMRSAHCTITMLAKNPVWQVYSNLLRWS